MVIHYFLEPSAEIVPEYSRFTDRDLWDIWFYRTEDPDEIITYSQLVLRGTMAIESATCRLVEDGCAGQPNTNETFRHEMREVVMNQFVIAALCIQSGLHRELPDGERLAPLSDGMSDVELSAASLQFAQRFYAHYAAWEMSDPGVAQVWLDRLLKGFFCRLMLCIREQLIRWKLWSGSPLGVETKARWFTIAHTAVISMEPRDKCRDIDHIEILPTILRDSVRPEIELAPITRLPAHKLLAKWGMSQAVPDDVDWAATVSQT